MKVVDIIEMLEAQIEQLKEKYCAECQEWLCENCGADMRGGKDES